MIPEALGSLISNDNEALSDLKEYLEGPMQPRLNDFYLYVKSDRVLTVLKLLMGNNIQSINKVVCLNKNA